MPHVPRILRSITNHFQQEGSHRRHVVRYRLHPYKPTDEANAAINQFIETTNFDDLGNFDDDELEVRRCSTS